MKNIRQSNKQRVVTLVLWEEPIVQVWNYPKRILYHLPIQPTMQVAVLAKVVDDHRNRVKAPLTSLKI